jgi:hypothetical protein
VSREAIRMAIGQLADYGRFVSGDPRAAVLVPEEPRGDLLALLKGQGIAAIWPMAGGFTDTVAGALV